MRTAPAPAPAAPDAQDPLLSSRPAPFQVAPDAAPAGAGANNDQTSYAGNPPVQDLSSLLSGNFKNTKYKWYGFVRLDAIYDLRPMGTTDAFVTSAIPVPQGRGQNFAMNPRYTRLGWDTETPLTDWDWTIKTRIEVDFFNGFSSGGFGTFPLRLRFAWADFGPFLIGQAASLFMDYDVFPNVLDYEGPGGMVLMRQPIAAIRIPFGDKIKVAVGVEQPYSDIQWFENGGWIRNPGNGIITTPNVGRNVQDLPDFTGNVRYVGDYGHLQVAGIARKLTFQPATGESAFDEFGYGVNVTGTFHPWAYFSDTPRSGDCSTAMSRSRFLGQYAAGRGINRYVQDVNGLGLDATFDPVNGFRAIPTEGWFMCYEQWWGKKWASVFTYGENDSDLTDTLPGSTYVQANYVSANLIWLPTERMGVGIEALHGHRRNFDGQRGENSRLQMAFQYKF
ncbi:MAG TPA: DcaP family trimeric outer membrane transporter [Planctomycetia bacterium]|nr:DcaP family trimeric outer membrane transporter [Planctomycetia bacterium]